MYTFIKKTISFFLPKKLLFSFEPFLRNGYSLFYKGTNHHCVLCDFKANKWINNDKNDKLCPKCGSLSRDRRLWSILKESYLKENSNVLDFSPSRSLFRKWKKEKKIHHIATDLSGNFMADKQFDITQIAVNANTFDIIICYHVLEHVVEDQKAIKELYRVLKPNGTVLIQTPFKEGAIYEDYTITSEKERLKHFGQEDHVRVYSVLGLIERIKKAGFKTEVLNFTTNNYYGFSDKETILIAKK